ncbi:MAG: succinyl-diaminopimelate desuccinylase [Proteobacteria bacterium]|nr:succinyl-diaminopimelate desuccinylase [Pseudomonadota bacterium]
MIVDPVRLSQDLIRRPSVTPKDEGAIGVLEAALKSAGFTNHRLPFAAPGTAEIQNLYAVTKGDRPGRNICFAGHTDVVPVGHLESWSIDPFAAEIQNGKLYGRGASDMKSAIAAFAAAAARFTAKRQGKFAGAISLLITGDEEGPAVNGTKPVLDWLAGKGWKLDACIVGEPTNPTKLGEMAKIGRRGSFTGRLTVHGIQGHSAYPHLADNPIHRLSAMIAALTVPLDDGSAHFPATSLQFVTVDVGNPATNVIPAEAKAVFNSRFNDLYTAKSLEAEIRRRLDTVGGRYDLTCECSGESFLTPPGALSDLLVAAVKAETGLTPELSTTGGTSDARFIKNYCPVIEFGLAGATMHKVDEHVPVADIETLSRIYERVLDAYLDA